MRVVEQSRPSELFAFAGLWDRRRDASGNNVETRLILTTTSNTVTAAVHDRMPVIIDPDNYDLWLDPGMQNVSEASELLNLMYPVITCINSVVNDDEECPVPVELVGVQSSFFS